ncbi:MAG TPA: serine hydrolase domain-containing protein [Brevundimonas sp.]|jgi:CubicO group peptidase (beta-lactamase class C family)|uniref:serine hydrolase domain-containing protein n=1 Tax=Brevundimonas sp. TaxID=1871086 RepID=UPI002C7A1F79|nr:serine hydrolase domain-containing protein [Brevundimonas sp.]HRH19627.1 serine hydrolase domain-containing protein [Brevundimonas sp.]
MPTPRPETLGFNAGRLSRLDTFLKTRYLDSGRLPHAQILISRHGELAHFSSQGPAREGSSRPIDEGSIFRIASMTKPVTSVAFMQLLEQGKVALDTPVQAVLPEFSDVGVYAAGGAGVPFMSKPLAEPMRMLDLLRHTSGLTYGFQNRTNIDAAYRETRSNAGPVENWHGAADLDTFIRDLATVPLEFVPGTAWNYSVSTDVLGAVVQRISGQPLDQYLAEHIFKPLAMPDTAFWVPPEKAGRLTDCYAWVDPKVGRLMYDRGEDSVWLTPPTLVSGGGGLVSTALDYHRFCQMLQNGGVLGDVRILGRKTLDLMTANHLPGASDLSSLSRSMFSETQNAGIGFGLGFAVTQDPARAMIPGSVGEFYWGGMFTTSFFVDPVEDLHVVFMTQLSPSLLYPIRREIKTLVYSALI